MTISVSSSSGSTLQGSTAVDGTAVSGLIMASGATFITNGTRVGDRAVRTSGSHDGTYNILAVMSETEIWTDGSFTTADGNVSTVVGVHDLKVSEQDWTWADIAADATAGKFVQELPLAGAAATNFTLYAHHFNQIEMEITGATNREMSSEREVVCPTRDDLTGGVTLRLTGGGSGTYTMRLGNVSATDITAIDDGSAWFGIVFGPTTEFRDNTKFVIEAYGSLIHTVQGMVTGKSAGELSYSLLYNDSSSTTFNTGATLRNISIISGQHSFSFLASPTSVENIFVHESSATTVFGGVSPTIEGVGFSENAFTPLVNPAIMQNVVFLNPQGDPDITDLVPAGDILGATTLKYTFNPRFVESMGIGVAPRPISGVEVEVYEADIDRGVKVLNATDGTYDIIINGASHQYVASSTTTQTIYNNLKTQVNGGAQPVTAVGTSVAQPMRIVADDEDVAYTLAVSSPASGLEIHGEASEVTGSAFTTTSAGLLNGTGGYDALSATRIFASYGDWYRTHLLVKAFKAGFEPFEMWFHLKGKFEGDITLKKHRPNLEGH